MGDKLKNMSTGYQTTFVFKILATIANNCLHNCFNSIMKMTLIKRPFLNFSKQELTKDGIGLFTMYSE